MDEKLVLEHYELSQRIACSMARTYCPMVDRDDLKSAALDGLIDAVQKFDPKQSVNIKTYISFRVRGAILDFIRRQDHVSRYGRRVQKKRAEGQSLTSEERKYLNTTAFKKVSLQSLEINFNEIIAEDFELPSSTMEKGESIHFLTKAIEKLSDEEDKWLIHQYYFGGMKMPEMATLQGLSLARISQKMKRALGNLRKIYIKLAA